MSDEMIQEMAERLAAAETLARHADRDVADVRELLRAQTSLIQALRETQNGMNRVLGEQGTAFGGMLLVLDRATERLGHLEQDLSQLSQALERREQDMNRTMGAVHETLELILRRLPPSSLES